MLTADLVTWRKKLADPKDAIAVRNKMVHWQNDVDFVFVRHPWLTRFLPANERLAWERLWTDVRKLEEDSKRSIR